MQNPENELDRRPPGSFSIAAAPVHSPAAVDNPSDEIEAETQVTARAALREAFGTA